MEKKVTMDFLAKKLNVSKTTISKAVNNCPGISSKTKNIVSEVASSYGYIKTRKRHRVAVVLPSVPDYFWGEMRRCIKRCSEESGCECNYYVYPDISDNKSAIHCIDRALEDKASVLILAAGDSKSIRQRLEAVAQDVLVILIEEFMDIKNTFYVGEDSYLQGLRLGNRYISAFPTSEYFLILKVTDFYTEEQRIRGFSEALSFNNKKIIANVMVNSGTKAKAANIARILAEQKILPDCIFCPSGNMLHASEAVKKLKTDKEIHCIGFDMYTGQDFNKDILTHILFQDIGEQAKKAWECAENFLHSAIFPDCKKIYVESIYSDR